MTNPRMVEVTLIDCGFGAVRVKRKDLNGSITLTVFSPSDCDDGRYAPPESCELFISEEQAALIAAALAPTSEADHVPK